MSFKTKSQISVIMFFIVALIAAGCKREEPASTSGSAPAEASKKDTFRVGIVYFGPDPGADNVIQGIMDSLKQEGFEEGKNLEVQKAHAQGEIPNIPMLLQNYDSQQFDVIVPLSTPCLTAACLTVKNTPVVFSYVYDPIAAGAGKSFTDHLPNVTGVGSFPPIDDTVSVFQKLVPGVKSIGVVYNSSEANSRRVIEVAREAFGKQGIRLEEATATATGEVYQAAQAAASRNVQAMWGTGDNTMLQAFEGVVKASADKKLPLIINDPEFVQRGALLAVGIAWYDSGVSAGKMIARVLRGEKTADIPFVNVAKKQLVLNQEVANQLGITFPPELIQEAQAAP